MNKEREALKLALEALDGLSEPYDVLKAQDAIKKALAQPEQEPVALPEGKRLILVDGSFDDLMFWLDRCEDNGHLENCPDLVPPWENFSYEAYTIPPQRTWERPWVSLTDEEMHQLNDALNLNGRFPIISAIEAKLKAKNGFHSTEKNT